VRPWNQHLDAQWIIAADKTAIGCRPRRRTLTARRLVALPPERLGPPANAAASLCAQGQLEGAGSAVPAMRASVSRIDASASMSP
jgi:hypothetical protein